MAVAGLSEYNRSLTERGTQPQREWRGKDQEPLENVTHTGHAMPNHKRWVWAPVALVAAAAVVMGLPNLSGAFVGGDDHRLLLDHVLVNHPSFEHALELFTIFHRDLYQPLPLLTFQLEFALAQTLGLFDVSLAGGARLFHLTNIILHAINAVLVWFVVRSLHDRITTTGSEAPSPIAWKRAGGGASAAIATVAALLFAVHPLQMEVIAWTNGRMMLLSTLFALLSVLAFASWLERPRPRWIVLTVLFVLLCSISKVRIGLPVLLGIVALAGHATLTRRLVTGWLTCTLVTACFVVVNVRATAGADLFAEAAEHLTGPRFVRVVLALGNYFHHLVWPLGLASYYPTPPTVYWSDLWDWRVMATAILGVAALAWTCRRWRVARLGTLWFAATIAATLPILPARNVLAADRYMYLPIIGLLWLISTLGYRGYQRWCAARSPTSARAGVAMLAIIILPGYVGMSWHVARFYATPMRKTQRIADLFPDTPRVWEPVGWAHYHAGQYASAIECAEKELRHDAPSIRSGAYQLQGMCELRRGNNEEALRLLHHALEVDPDSGLGKFRLGLAYDALDRPAEALPAYEAAVEAAPGNNRAISQLAIVYRRLGRADDARAMYEQQLENNPYEVPASMGLVELDIARGTGESYVAAESRLRTLLAWMPENAAALTNLGAVLVALGRADEAVAFYRSALEIDPHNAAASLNLAELHHRAGDVDRAGRMYRQAMAAGLSSVEEVSAVHDFFVSQGEFERGVELWKGFVRRYPDSGAGRAFLAWSRALAGFGVQGRGDATALAHALPPKPLALSTLVYIELVEANYDRAVEHAETLCGLGDASAARKRLLGALERFDRARPGVPWTFCLVARLIMVDDTAPAVEVSIGMCEQRCHDDACRRYIRTLRAKLEK